VHVEDLKRSMGMNVKKGQVDAVVVVVGHLKAIPFFTKTTFFFASFRLP
jgi:hypothetical protein